MKDPVQTVMDTFVAPLRGHDSDAPPTSDQVQNQLLALDEAHEAARKALEAEKAKAFENEHPLNQMIARLIEARDHLRCAEKNRACMQEQIDLLRGELASNLRTAVVDPRYNRLGLMPWLFQDRGHVAVAIVALPIVDEVISNLRAEVSAMARQVPEEAARRNLKHVLQRGDLIEILQEFSTE